MECNAVFRTERAWIEVSAENLHHNVRVLQEAMPAGCELMAVVKCEAYGHGLRQVAEELKIAGVRAFAVATIEEGIKLREYGIQGEILILGYTDVRRAPELKQYDLIQTLIDFCYAKELNEQGVGVKVHIKIDTGMHRLGIPYHASSDVEQVFAMKHIKVYGMFTHLCCPDSRLLEDVAFTKEQIGNFYQLVDALKKNGIAIPKLHIQSSYGFLNYPDLHCDYARMGIALYGVLSSAKEDTVLSLPLRPVLSLKSKIVLIRNVSKGSSVGYGRAFTPERDSRIAILPIGYGDGFPRGLSETGASVRIKGHVAPVIGRICMDQLAVDITDAADAAVGDIATLIDGKTPELISAPSVAERFGSISNELLCRMGARLPVVVI